DRKIICRYEAEAADGVIENPVDVDPEVGSCVDARYMMPLSVVDACRTCHADCGQATADERHAVIGSVTCQTGGCGVTFRDDRLIRNGPCVDLDPTGDRRRTESIVQCLVGDCDKVVCTIEAGGHGVTYRDGRAV